jgi:hypothetical protein
MIQFEQLKTEIKNITFETLRTDGADYFEAVLTREHLSELTSKLEQTFGLPAWPSKTKLSPQVKEKIEEFGGVWEGQTLYFANPEGNFLLAMLWPWQDGEHITLKIAKR